MHKILLFFSVLSALAFGKVSASVPVSSPAYSMIERLESWGCALSTFRGVQPQSYADLVAAITLPEGAECAAPEWLMRERELFLQPKLPSDGKLSLLVGNDSLPLQGIQAQVHPVYPLQEGRTAFDGVNLYGELTASAEAGKNFGIAVLATPGFLFALDDYRHLDARFYLAEGYVKLGYKRAEILFGRQELSFGDATHGSLALSKAAKPLDLVKFTVRPHVLPSLLSYLGPTTLETWFAGMGDAGGIKNSKMWGIQFGMRPFTFLEFALLQMYQIGGDGIPGLHTSDFLKMLFYSNDPSLSGKRRESMATHLGIWGPSRTFKLYQQFFANRLGPFGDSLSNDLGVLVGLWLPRLGQGELRIEYVHTPPGLYSSPLYRQGWSNENTPIGCPLGSDAEGLYLDFGLPPLSEFRPTVSFSYESRNRNPARGTMTEWRYGIGGQIQKRWDKLDWLLGIEEQYSTNDRYIAGIQRNALSVISTLRYSFL